MKKKGYNLRKRNSHNRKEKKLGVSKRLQDIVKKDPYAVKYSSRKSDIGSSEIIGEEKEFLRGYESSKKNYLKIRL